jgi:hypothetical protein
MDVASVLAEWMLLPAGINSQSRWLRVVQNIMTLINQARFAPFCSFFATGHAKDSDAQIRSAAHRVLIAALLL